MTITKWGTIAASTVALLTFVGGPTLAADGAFSFECKNCPQAWGNLTPPNNCNGTGQSPIALNFGDAKKTRKAPRLTVRYDRDIPLAEVNKGTNIEWDEELDGVNTVRFGGRKYDFLQFHFHSTAEHVVGGERSALEMHFVNIDENNNLLVLGVFINEGKFNKAFQPIVDSIKTGGEQHIYVDLKKLLPRRLKSVRYTGSLTTPPCSGGVQWVLLKKQVTLSKGQIDAIQGTLRGLNNGFDNNRTVQNLEGRAITARRW